MEGDLTHLALATALGTAVLVALGLLIGRKPQRAGGGLALVFVGLLVGQVLESIAPPAVLGLSDDDLRVAALMDDADLRNRFNVDGRLRFIPTEGSETIVNLESGYRIDAPLRTVDFGPVRHETYSPSPRSIEQKVDNGDYPKLRGEVAGLYRTSQARVVADGRFVPNLRPLAARSEATGPAAYAFLLIGVVTLVVALGWSVVLLYRWRRDVARLGRMAEAEGYAGGKREAMRQGSPALKRLHFGPAARLPVFWSVGAGMSVAGLLAGIAHEHAEQTLALETFRAARFLRVDLAAPVPKPVAANAETTTTTVKAQPIKEAPKHETTPKPPIQATPAAASALPLSRTAVASKGPLRRPVASARHIRKPRPAHRRRVRRLRKRSVGQVVLPVPDSGN